MKYEWEAKLKDCDPCGLPEGFRLMGFAVENMETGEAAFFSLGNNAELHDVPEADIWQDVLGDVRREYEAVASVVFGWERDE